MCVMSVAAVWDCRLLGSLGRLLALLPFIWIKKWRYCDTFYIITNLKVMCFGGFFLLVIKILVIIVCVCAKIVAIFLQSFLNQCNIGRQVLPVTFSEAVFLLYLYIVVNLVSALYYYSEAWLWPLKIKIVWFLYWITYHMF